MKAKDPITGEMKRFGVKVGDTLPLHSQIDYDGDTVPLGWKQIKDDDKVIVSTAEPTGGDRKKVWLQHSNNLAWFNNVTTNSTGTEYRIDNIKPNTAYTITYIKSRISGVTISVIQVYLYNSIKFYNNSGTLLDTISSTSSDIVTLSTTPVEFEKTFTTPANTSYIVFDLGNHNGDFNNNTLISNIMLNAGSTALEYEDYVDDKTFVLNENDIYEEFVPQNEVYSTKEIKIGKWINGKNLYRKSLVVNADFANWTVYNNMLRYQIQSNINNIDNIWFDEQASFCKFSNGYITTINNYLNTTDYIKCNINISTGIIQIMTSTNYTSVTGTIVVTIRYTKTTD